jgi:tripartite motif-containing protein 71
VDSAGQVYVTDSAGAARARIAKFTDEGVLLTIWGSWGSEDGQMKAVINAEVDSTGSLWVSDSGNDRILKYAAEGTLEEVLGSWGTSPGRFRLPSGVAVGPLGDVYVADTENNRVQRFSDSGAFLNRWRGGPPPPNEVAADWFNKPARLPLMAQVTSSLRSRQPPNPEVHA